MIFELKVEMGNAAMLTKYDLSAALSRVARRVREGEMNEGVIVDANGNKCGSYAVDYEGEG